MHHMMLSLELVKGKIADPVQLMQMSKYPVAGDSEAHFLLQTHY